MSHPSHSGQHAGWFQCTGISPSEHFGTFTSTSRNETCMCAQNALALLANCCLHL
jgi:hypothetical protein